MGAGGRGFEIGEIPSWNHAVIIDEAHSSQGGEATKKMKEVLAGASLQEALAEEGDQEDEDTDWMKSDSQC